MSDTTVQPVYSPFATLFRLLTFRATREEMAAFDNRHLALGFLTVWATGIGRSWDDAKAGLWQHLGVGSLIYVFFLALLLWVTVKALAPHVSYKHVLTFVCLTALPGLIYALPVEKWFDAATARNLNSCFLAFVAIWRVALLVFYFRHYAGLSKEATAIGTLLPLATIMAPLTIFRVLLEIEQTMGGIREGPPPSAAEGVATSLGTLSIFLFLPLLIYYQILCGRAKNKERTEGKNSI